ncbi:MAG: hypothetical protein H0Z24_03260 [Thermosipho sp. (in: Bacteria)]|nr:hypothetical protein [Thermosipho sp. (in: thermotogales)]
MSKLPICGFVGCQHNSNYDNDFSTGPNFCTRKEGLCEAGRGIEKISSKGGKGRVNLDFRDEHENC